MKPGTLSLIAVSVIACLSAAVPAMAEPDSETGRKVFARCAACHSLQPGVIKVGPSLNRIVGRKAGTEAGFRYSKAMAASGLIWTEKNLDRYIANPKKMVPGNRMPFWGVADLSERTYLIAYLRDAAKAP